MIRSTIKSVATLAMLLLTPVLHAQDEIPEKCAPFVDSVDRCQRFESLLGSTGWKVEYHKTFKKDDKLDDVAVQTPQMQGQVVPPLIEKVKDEGGVLRFNAAGYEQGLLKIGPVVSGEFAVEMKIRAIAGQLCDLSFICDGVGQSPAFQFGGYGNSRNRLAVGEGENARSQMIESTDEPHIVQNQWYRVRLEVTKKEMIGYVDGQAIVRGKATEKYDFTKSRQPLVYVYSTSAEIADYRVERPAPNAEAADVEKAWKEAFVNKTREQVIADMTELTKLLADSDFATRQGAHDLLARAGKIAADPLKAAAKAGPLEKRERARSLLLKLGITVVEE